jgi:hypothetical protein
MPSVGVLWEHMFVRTKRGERARARLLRRRGMPYRRIAARLRVSVNSAYRWTRDIDLTPEQRERNLRRPDRRVDDERVARAASTWSARCRAWREACQADGRATAREADPLHLAGCMLYWAEGTKGRNSIGFTNSDPRMLVLFRRFLTDSLRIPVYRVLLSINVYTDNGSPSTRSSATGSTSSSFPQQPCGSTRSTTCPRQAAAGRRTSFRTAYARCGSTTAGCSSTSTARFRSTAASTSLPGFDSGRSPRSRHNGRLGR